MRCEILLLQWISAFAKKMDCALMIITSNDYGIKCLCCQLQLDTCNVMLKVFSDMLAHRYEWEIH